MARYVELRSFRPPVILTGHALRSARADSFGHNAWWRCECGGGGSAYRVREAKEHHRQHKLRLIGNPAASPSLPTDRLGGGGDSHEPPGS